MSEPYTYRREEIRMSHLKVMLSDAWVGDGYRLSHAQMRTPVPNGDDCWVPNYSWDLPADGLTADEVRERLAEYNADAQRRYQAQKQQLAEVTRSIIYADQLHPEPEHEVRTERWGGADRSWIVD